MQYRITLKLISRMAPVVSWISADEEEAGGIETPIREVGEVDGVWEGFDGRSKLEMSKRSRKEKMKTKKVMVRLEELGDDRD